MIKNPIIMKKFILSLITTFFTFYVVSAQHFNPVWDGNGLGHMNFYVFQATIDGIDLETGDEIGIFDGDLCVGAAIVPHTINANLDSVLEIRTSKDDPTTTDSIDGFNRLTTIVQNL